MKLPVRSVTARLSGARAKLVHPPGTYLGCAACGRLLKIEWATRSIVCSCGARLAPTPSGKQG